MRQHRQGLTRATRSSTAPSDHQQARDPRCWGSAWEPSTGIRTGTGIRIETGCGAGAPNPWWRAGGRGAERRGRVLAWPRPPGTLRRSCQCQAGGEPGSRPVRGGIPSLAPAANPRAACKSRRRAGQWGAGGACRRRPVGRRGRRRRPMGRRSGRGAPRGRGYANLV